MLEVLIPRVLTYNPIIVWGHYCILNRIYRIVLQGISLIHKQFPNPFDYRVAVELESIGKHI